MVENVGQATAVAMSWLDCGSDGVCYNYSWTNGDFGPGLNVILCTVVNGDKDWAK